MPNRRTLGPALLHVGSFVLLSAGIFAIALGATGQFLPHDEQFLGMSAADLCSMHACRIVHFMIHDRVSFGGTLIALGIVYHWLVAVPLRGGEPWAWWTLIASAGIGFASFFAYLGYGYFDTWHGLASLSIFPCFLFGLILTRIPGHIQWQRRRGLGRPLLLATTFALMVGGLTITFIGMTFVFVPEDLNFMELSRTEVAAIHPRLVPLIAHDRAGFGGAVASCGVALFLCVWFGRPSRSLWISLTVAGIAGFGSAIGVHPAIGYVDFLHLAPAVLGAAAYFVGLLLCYREMFGGEERPS